MSRAYYNEIDPFAAQWLRNLITAGHIAPGDVDERDIRDVRATDLVGYTQCHFFAGIGGWSYALRLAGWPDARPVWTGSCPCQPFSSAGKGDGADDPRHLWPSWFGIIRECRPSVVFGEQVASVDGLAWLDLVSTDLEGQDYAIGAADLCAPSVGAYDIRQRLWFVAYAQSQLDWGWASGQGRWVQPTDGSSIGLVADASGERRIGEQLLLRAEEAGRDTGDLLETTRGSKVGELADAARRDQRRHGGRTRGETGAGCCEAWQAHGDAAGGSSAMGFWSNADWIFCRDGKWRPVEPGTQQMVDGLSRAVGRLRATAVVAEKVDGQTRQAVTSEIVRALRRGNDPVAVWQSLGRCLGFPAATLLLAALCEQSRELGSFFYGQTSRISEESKAVLREMPCNGQAACSSQGWQLPQQLLDELTDALPTLSQAGAPLAGFTGHPLAHGVSGRVGRLRAYGNAIKPQVAAVFIRASVEALAEVA